MKVADEVWTAVALLHNENPGRVDFSVQEIKARARRENWSVRQGFNVHASYHCLADKPANPANHRMLHEDSRGRRRLYKPGDPNHPEREQGRIRPDKEDLPLQYQSLIDWYDTVYSKQPPPSAASSGGAAGPAQLGTPHSVSTVLPASQPDQKTAFVSSAGALVLPESLRKELGIDASTRISIFRENDRLVLQPVTAEYIDSLMGCCKGKDSLVEARERDHRIEKR
jgi:bifunctional DNA-binding transcriptional regulator/antitoxin component of YhaV-PrlF toxin-antitoxin module